LRRRWGRCVLAHDRRRLAPSAVAAVAVTITSGLCRARLRGTAILLAGAGLAPLSAATAAALALTCGPAVFTLPAATGLSLLASAGLTLLATVSIRRALTLGGAIHRVDERGREHHSRGSEQ
jgi:hypothetical protein